MTPKEKANELYDTLFDIWRLIETEYSKVHTKRCAYVVCDQMIMEYLELARIIQPEQHLEAVKYWNAVKKEIELL